MSNEAVGTVGSGGEGVADVGGDAASWEALKAEFEDDSDPGSNGSEPGGDDTSAAAEPAKADGDDKEQPAGNGEEKGETGKPTAEQLAQQYQAAMREERQRRQELEQRVREIQDAIRAAKEQRQQQEQPKPPSIDEDPVAYFEHQQRLLAEELRETRQTLSQEQAAREQRSSHEQFINNLANQEQQFASQAPDYWDAANHLRETRMSQLAMLYPSTEQGDAVARQNGFQSAEIMRQAHLDQEIQMYASQAMAVGRNPAEVFYELAKSAGYAKAAAPAQQQITPQRKAEMARAGAKRAESLSGGGGSGGNADNATAAELAELYMSDPEAADALFDKLAASGALG